MAIVGTIPNTITNGQVEDAAPVMANFNWIISQVNANAAALAAANSFLAVQSGVAASVGANFPITSQVQNNAFNWGGTAGGTANALTLTPAVAVAAYTGGQLFWFKAGASNNSGATTIAISGLATIAVQVEGAACVGGEIVAGRYYFIMVDGSATSCQLGHITNAQSIPDAQLQLNIAFTTGGSATAFTLTPTQAITANAANIAFWAQFHAAAGAAPTLSVSGKTALPLVYLDSTGTEQAVTATQCPINWRGRVVQNAAATKWVLYDIPMPQLLRSYLAGLKLSTAGSSATMTVAAGQATDTTNAVTMNLASAMAKTTSAWAAGTGNGGLDTGAIANGTWYHFYLIAKPDGTTDVAISLSASAPTLPAGYSYSRRIGSGLTNGSAQWVLFTQDGDYFRLSASVLDVNATNPGTSSVTATLASVPTGINVRAMVNVNIRLGTSTSMGVYVRDLAASDEAPNNPVTTSPAAPGSTLFAVSGGGAAYTEVRTNTSAQIGYRCSASGASDIIGITTLGWIDRRGRDS